MHPALSFAIEVSGLLAILTLRRPRPRAVASQFTGPTQFGDVTCDTDVNAGDAITILQHVAEVALVPEPPSTCAPVGELLPQ